MSQYGVKMRGMGVALPDHIVKNDDIATLVETSDEWIFSRTGFRERRVMSGDEKVIDLGIEAARQALAFANMKGEDIDLIILASSTPDNIYPAGCGVIQQAIGAHSAYGFDMVMACSGLIYAMGTAIQFIQNGTAKNALVVGADAHSRYTDWYDRNTCVLFGDGSGAFILSRSEDPGDNDVLAVDFMLDGSRGKEITLAIHRENCPLADPRGEREKDTVYMNGREVFKFAVSDVPKQMEKALAKAGMTSKDVDHYVLHQANDRIMSAMVERMDIRPEQMVVSLERYGNTSAASIPLAFHDALASGQVKPGDTVLFCGFGAGLAIATTVVKWSCVDHRPKSGQSEPVAQTV